MAVSESNKSNNNGTSDKLSLFSRIYNRIYGFIQYCISGVWNDPRQSLKVRIIKTLNLSVNSFLDRDLQIKSMALTYYMVLALVPAIALLVAIGRGFGLQDSLQEELYYIFPSQHKVITTALQFVDSYLNEASQGIFVGVGIVVLLWTVISLLSYIEDAFNTIWDVKGARSLYQKITDYIAICLIIPILMICSSGVSIFMSTTIQDNLIFPFLTPVWNITLELAPLVLAWMAFTFTFFFVPSAKVKFKYAAISGALCALAFQILQMLFVNGQIYVSKYNAIYGSFAFLPLMLVWLQLSWMILLSGCVLTYSLQNVFTFNFLGDASEVSNSSRNTVALIIMCVIVKRFEKKETPLSASEIASLYNLPVRIVNKVADKLLDGKLIYRVKLQNDITGLSPALEVSNLSAGSFFHTFNTTGIKDVIPDFENIYKEMLDILKPVTEDAYQTYDTILIKDIPLPTPDMIRSILINDIPKESPD